MIFHIKPLLIGGLAMFLAACSSQSDIVGSYIASDADNAFMVQVSSVVDGHVNGTMSAVVVADDGKINAFTRSMSGTIEDGALNLTVENGTGVSVVTGIVKDDALDLTFLANGSSSKLTFAKSEAAKFDEQVTALRVQAANKGQAIETAAAQKNRIEQRGKLQAVIDQFANTMFAKAQEVQAKTKKIDLVVAGYRAAGERAGKMAAAKNGIDRNSYDGDYKASQIDYQIDAISNDVSTMHSSVQDYKRSLEQFRADAAVEMPRLMGECRADKLLNCNRLPPSLQSFKNTYVQFNRAYSRENAVFNSLKMS